MAILRSLGASSRHVLFLLLYESSFLVFMGCVLGVASMYGLLYFVRPWLESNFSLYLPIEALSKTEWIYLGVIFIVGTLAGAHRTVTVLHEGKVLAEGTMDKVQSDERVIEVYLGR